MEQTIHESEVGPVVDVGEPTRGKLFSLAALHAVYGIFLLPSAFTAPVWGIHGALTGQHPAELYAPVWALVMLFAGFLFLYWGTIWVRRLRAAFEVTWFRAGHGGISVRATGEATLASLAFGYEILEHDIPWEAIARWYPYTLSVNLVPMESSIVFEGVDGWVLSVPTYHFAGSRQALADRIAEAAEADLGPPPSS